MMFVYVYNNYDKVVEVIPNFNEIIKNSSCVSLKQSNQGLSEQGSNSAYIAFLACIMYKISH